jgi:CelD/BcsL family acetyltransferase involved in cellulose biosynthesis
MTLTIHDSRCAQDARLSSATRIFVVSASQLSSQLISTWSDLQKADPALANPFFRPEFTQAVAAVRNDVEVAVVEQDQSPVGFFPFQRRRGNVGLPVGGRMSDFQGVVLKSGVEIDPLQLIRGCGLSAWHFDHLLSPWAAFEPHQWTVKASPYIDASRGWDAYFADRRDAGGLTLKKMARKLRKLEREIGPARFEMSTQDEQVFETLVRWKTEQYRASNLVDLFSFGWTERLLRLLLTKTDASFSGVMSAWYVKDELAAVHFGMRSHGVSHSWFPAYRTDLSRHSPGSQLLIEIIKAAQGLGIERIDLGAGNEEYKASFMSGALTVAVGSVDSRPGTATMHRLWHHTKRWVRESSFRKPAALPWRFIRHLRDQVQFR